MEDGVLKCFKHILFATEAILAQGKPANARQEDWDLALEAALALAED